MRILIMLTALWISMAGWAQQELPGGVKNGYESTVKGGNFQYHSPQPDVTTSMLLRSIDSAQYIEWNTGLISPDRNEKTVQLIWMFGMDANMDSHRYRLFLNERFCLAFSNPVVSDINPWTVNGSGGTQIQFRPVMIDKYGDPMGYAILSVPASYVRPGETQRIRVSGESAESRTWYMTFETAVRESITVNQVPAIVRDPVEGPALKILFRFVHLGDPAEGTILIPGRPEKPFRIGLGYNEVPIILPEKTSPGVHQAIINIRGRKPVIREFTIAPVRHMTVFLVQHTHTDIGYTRPQTEILPDHLRYIDYALDFCDQTDSLPPEAQFRWTCETSWAVREYLKTRPAGQIDRLRRRAREGRIELTGLFLNASDLSDETMIAVSLKPLKLFSDSGFTIRAAMQSDINGVPWCLVDYLSDAGVRYLNMAQNTHRAMKPFDLPTLFWWQSLSGKRILVNRPEHYMWGNTLGILSHAETFGTALLRHLDDIFSKGYPFDSYAIQFSGYLTDNAPPSTTACQRVNEWNRMYVWPKLKLATLSGFFDAISQRDDLQLPVIEGAWPDWWMDGFGSAALQTAQARAAHSDYIANNGLLSLAAAMNAGTTPDISNLRDQIADDILFYDEHTFGAAESISDPQSENSVVQKAEKESYVWSAVKKNHLLRELVMGRLQQFLPRSEYPALTVFNASERKRSGNTKVYIDHQLLPADREFLITDAGGQPLPMQMISTREEGTWWMIHMENVPAWGTRSLQINVTPDPRKPVAETPFSGIFENEYYRVLIDQTTGKIRSLVDKSWNLELLDQGAPHSLGEVILERLGKNRGQLEQYRLDEYTRNTWTGLDVSGILEGPVFSSVSIRGELPGCSLGPVTCQLRLYNHEKKIELVYSMKKLPVTDPEGVYVSFPFLLENSKLLTQVAGAVIRPGYQQVEGSATDWIGIQDFASLQNDHGQIVFVSPDIPLIHPGSINLGHFRRLGMNGQKHSQTTEKQVFPESGHIYSWVMNNYWTTNFFASQEGELRWSYQITSGTNPDNGFATQFGRSCRIPMPVRVFPGVKGNNSPVKPVSCMPEIDPESGLSLISSIAGEDGKSIVMHWRETNGHADSMIFKILQEDLTELPARMEITRLSEVNVAGELLHPLWNRADITSRTGVILSLPFKPFETKFIRIDMEPLVPMDY